MSLLSEVEGATASAGPGCGPLVALAILLAARLDQDPPHREAVELHRELRQTLVAIAAQTPVATADLDAFLNRVTADEFRG